MIELPNPFDGKEVIFIDINFYDALLAISIMLLLVGLVSVFFKLLFHFGSKHTPELAKNLQETPLEEIDYYFDKDAMVDRLNRAEGTVARLQHVYGNSLQPLEGNLQIGFNCDIKKLVNDLKQRFTKAFDDYDNPRLLGMSKYEWVKRDLENGE